MSVINKVLRDLDQRQAAAAAQAAGGQAAPDQVMRGTKVLTGSATRSHKRLWLGVAAIAALLLVGLTVWWMKPLQTVSAPDSAQSQPAQSMSAPVARSATETTSAPVPTSVALPTQTVLPIAPGGTPKPAPSVTAVVAAKPTVGAVNTLPVPVTQPAPVAPQVPAAHVLPNEAPLAASLASSAATLPVAQAKPANDHLQVGVTQALAQAQAMWNEGSRASAIDLLRQSLSRLEAVSQPGSSAVASTSLVALVRELVRMELADGQVGNALKLLTRLEPQIVQVADLWAMRGNSAQRLGQHAEAASSYQHALNLKPDEPRWLLGLAVSLAAQGQTAPAAELAEKVRAQGALRPEIASYLRQLGVVIQSD